MPTLTINGADLFYETFGAPKPGDVPVLLIHGSTGTGRSTWSTVARRLESGHVVLLPDCRGHGRSSNPGMTYSFREHAADLAALVRALGYSEVHVVGHSNGGCVALLMLMEHPEVTRTCVIQAGNAWVSPDLPVKEPPLFDPARIERERPAWMREMQELHSAVHGPDYWKTLVKLTVDEIVSQPTFTSADLARAARPTLVIEGTKDTVNAPMRHGEFLARFIPGAELWRPAGVGHTVHEEVLGPWLARVTDFWARRGTDAAERLDRHARSHYADPRDGPFHVRVAGDALRGTVLTETMRDEAALVTGLPAEDVRALLTGETPWVLVNRPVDDLRREPDSFAERTSQALLGEAARVLEAGPDWTRIRLERDGYHGWIHSKALQPCTAAEAAAWARSCNARVIAPLAEVPEADGGFYQKLAFATRVPVRRAAGGWSWIGLPDGREWRVRSADLVALADAPQPDPAGIRRTLDLLRRFQGIPYAWGGRTPYGYDCSGLAGIFYSFMGVEIPRDADQQYARGEVVPGDPQAGDLFYFGECPKDWELPGPDLAPAAPEPIISHVGICLGGWDFLHSNGSFWGISRSSLDPQSPFRDARLRELYRGARRFCAPQ